jgi:arsenite methyltransferase
MTEPTVPAKDRPDYGTDATVRQRIAVYGGVALVVAGRMLNERGVMLFADRLAVAGGVMIWIGLAFFVIGCLLLLGKKAGKLILRERILNSISWRGDEQVLDVGCGRGLLLVGAAKRLQAGHAVGLDIEGVAERIELKDGDVRELPIPDASFDIIVSSLAIHTISDAAGRESAIREMARVLKPGGQLALADLRYTQQYEQILRSLGWEQMQCLSTSFMFGARTRVLRATKP